MANRVVLLRIDNCLDCPHHSEFSDPGSDDSFDMIDTSVGCILTAGQGTKSGRNPKAIRIVSACERPGRHRKYCNVPEWCPLPVDAK